MASFGALTIQQRLNVAVNDNAPFAVREAIAA
jgi:hypothetical protein